MRRLAMVLPTLAMLLCLTAYGVNNSALARRRTTPPRTDMPLQPLKPMSASAMPPHQADALRDRREAVAHAAQVQEDQIIAQLGLSIQQLSAYSQLRQSIDQRIPPEDPAEAALFALQTASKFRSGLQEILTADQYRQYRELWSQHQGVYGSVKPDPEMNLGGAPVDPPAEASTPPE